MDGPPGGGGAGDELRRFRRLVDLTALTTVALIILGGVVRVSDSGLGCGPGGSGTEGWPLCGGEAIPLLSHSEVIIEFSHRLLAAVVAALIVLLAWTAYRHLRHLTWPLRLSVATGVLVLAQAGLGGLTVEKNLAEELVAAHLCLAMILLGMLLWMAVRARAELAAASEPTAGRPAAHPSGPGPEALRGRRRGAPALRDRGGRLRRRHREGGRRRQRAERQRRPHGLRRELPHLPRRAGRALRREPPLRHPPHPPLPGLRRDHRHRGPARRGARPRRQIAPAHAGRPPPRWCSSPSERSTSGSASTRR